MCSEDYNADFPLKIYTIFFCTLLKLQPSIQQPEREDKRKLETDKKKKLLSCVLKHFMMRNKLANSFFKSSSMNGPGFVSYMNIHRFLSFHICFFLLHSHKGESIKKPTTTKNIETILFGKNMILTFKMLFAHSHFHQFIFPCYENNLDA